ncbi:MULTISPECIES: hypothetical protein [Colwellia]|uniref:Metallohydrolase n=1 Tax=Colwellia marinimaniae TaxID=1513592 RepID=A0ABQ0MXH1_9GAMM|nr:MULTISPECIES: hypothetical protein [Colwellia]GAW97077.1 hypothetical protein MTCD1_02703 [Colwellia marinimaniae]
MTDYIKFLPVDNGDSILIRAGNKTVLTDIHYRTSSDEHYNIKVDIEDACPSNKLAYFIVTHTDRDHVRGFDELFHRGKPENQNDKILVEEIICSQYVIDLTNPSPEAKDLVNEIRRRNNLPEKERNVAGNKLRIVKANDNIKVNERLTGRVISPSKTELDNAAPKEDQDDAKNNTSIVIQWIYQDGNEAIKSKIMLGGDAEREVWARLHVETEVDKLNWNLTTAHHHCSLTPFAKKDKESGDYVDNKDAINAISNPINKKSFVVSSSRAVLRSKPNPPHYIAKNKWLNIIDDTEIKSRFFCTASHNDGNAAPVVFELNKDGIMLKKNKKVNTTHNTASVSAGLNRTTKYGKA